MIRPSEIQTDRTPEATAPPPRQNGLRRLYRWVLSWADTPYGTPALFGISFAESSFFPIPPDVLQIALSMSKPRRSYYYATVSAIASVLGGILGWLIGFAIWETVSGFFYAYVPGVTPEKVEYVGGLYEDNAWMAIFAAAFTPIPYKVFTITAGIFHDYVPLLVLISASAVGRSARFFLVASCIYFFGPQIKPWLEKYFEIVTFLLLAMVVLGFLALKYL